MCTVTFIPQANEGFILTSNRDEAPGRATFRPDIYNEAGTRLLYPKDAVAGGTWIGVSDKKRAISLMNGGFVPHSRKLPYRKSRGVVLKELLVFDKLFPVLDGYDFEKIEPFTAIVVEWMDSLSLNTVVWDGEQLHIIEEPLLAKIWSSSPLYLDRAKVKRQQWFSHFLTGKEALLKNEILEFHKTGGDGDIENNLIMDRGFVKTKSITQLVRNGDAVEMFYEDLETSETSRSLLLIN